MTPSESLARDLARLIIWYPFRFLMLLLPPTLGIALIRSLGIVHFFIAPKRVKQLTLHLQSLTDEELNFADRRKIVLSYLMNHYMDRLQIFLFPRWRKHNQTRPFIMLQGENHLRQALTAGKGAILVHPHFGPLQLMLYPLADCGFTLLQVGFPSAKNLSCIGRNVAFRLRLKHESMLPARIHPADKYIRPVFRHLAANGVLLITGDGAGGGELIGATRVVGFLDASMAFPEGPFKLARLTGAPILPAFLIPERTGYYKLVIGRPICHPGDPETTLDADIKSFAHSLQLFIHRFPAFWHFWDEWEEGKRKLSSQGLDQFH